MLRFRIEYHKLGALRYTGNLDMQKVWERYLRRADLPVSYSQGFHPQAKLQQACPLPLGFLSRAELVDIWLDDDQISAQEVREKLTTTGQPGVEVGNVSQVSLSDPALQSTVAFAQYQVELLEEQALTGLQAQIQRVLGASSIIRQRRDKSYDLRPLIETLELQPGSDPRQPVLEMLLAARDSATGRPDEVLVELGLNPNRARITRTSLFFTNYS